MHAGTQRRRGPMGHAIHETVGCFAAPQVRDRIIDAALGLSPWSELPEDAAEAREFIEGPLRMALVHYLGEHTAEAVVTDLEGVQAVYGGRAPVAALCPPTAPPPAYEVDDEAEPTVRADTHVRPREARSAPRLFVVSSRPAAEAVIERFQGSVSCVRTYDLEQTLNSLRRLGGAEAVVLVDGALIAGKGPQMTRAFESFKGKVFVALWDAPGSDSWEMERACAGSGWAYLPPEAEPAQVIAFLGRIIH